MAVNERQRRALHTGSKEAGPMQDDKMDKLVDNLNHTGRKLHELKAILYQESLYTGNDVDTIRWMMLSGRFSKQVRAVDSIRLASTTDVNVLSDITSKKELYHYYETELEDFHLRRGKQDLESLFNNTTFNMSTLGDRLSVNDHDDSVDGSSGGVDMNDNKTKSSSNSANVSTTSSGLTGAGRIPHLLDSSAGSLETQGADSSRPAPQKKALFADCETQTQQQEQDLENNNNGDSKAGAELTIDLFEDDHNDSEALFKLKSEEEDEKDEREKLLRVRAHSTPKAPLSHSKKCKVMKLKGREQKRHIQDVFPSRHSSPSVISSVTEIPSPRFLNTSVTDRTNGSFLSHGSHDSYTPLANKSKSANESWYEFKQRCSSSNLFAEAAHSQSNSSTSVSGTPFRLSDYIPNSPSTSQILRKSVRFSVTGRTPPSPRQAHHFDSSESTSDDEVSFDVQQFPCVPPQKQRNRGIMRR